MPPNSTAAPGASPPAYRRCVMYGTCPRTVWVLCIKYAAEPRISRLAITNTPTFASVVISWTPKEGSYEFIGRYSRHGVRLAVEELPYPRSEEHTSELQSLR